MSNEAATEMKRVGGFPPPPPGSSVALPAKPGVLAQVFGHFTQREFWVELLENVVKTAMTALIVAVGDSLIRFGKKRAGAENVELFNHAGVQTPPPPTQAYASRGYTPATEFRSGPTYPPVSSAQSQSFPGFAAGR